MIKEVETSYGSRQFQDYWTLRTNEYDSLQSTLTEDGINLEPRDIILLLGKIKQLRGIVLQCHLLNNYGDLPDPSFKLRLSPLIEDLPFPLLDWEKVTLQLGIEQVYTSMGKANQIKHRVLVEMPDKDIPDESAGEILFSLITDEEPKGKITLDPCHVPVVLYAEKLEDVNMLKLVVEETLRARQKYSNTTNNSRGFFHPGVFLHQHYQEGEGWFPLIVCSNPSNLDHEWQHWLNFIYRQALQRHYPAPWNRNKDNYSSVAQTLRRCLEGLLKEDQTIKYLKDTFKDGYKAFQQAICYWAQNELIAHFYQDEDLQKAKRLLKKSHQSIGPKPEVPFDYFHIEGVSKHHLANFPEIKQMAEEERERYYQTIDDGVKAIEKLQQFLESIPLALNLGLDNKSVIMAVMRQNPIKRWPEIVRVLISETNTPIMEKVMFHDTADEEIEAFYQELHRPYQNIY